MVLRVVAVLYLLFGAEMGPFQAVFSSGRKMVSFGCFSFFKEVIPDSLGKVFAPKGAAGSLLSFEPIL